LGALKKKYDSAKHALALKMTDDRNLTTHTYIEEVAEQIHKKLPRYYQLFSHLLIEIEEKV
jgi:hypothetical protein